MTTRERIMDKYWSEFLKSRSFENCVTRYEYATPLEAAFWEWFKINYLENMPPTPLGDYL